MLFRPENGSMWDTTVLIEDGIYHIFYLSSGNVGHVSTKDFLHFKKYPQINGFGKKGEWNERGLPLTGSIVKTKEGYCALLGTCEPVTEAQVYGLYYSNDLIKWRQYENNPVLRADGKIYSDKVYKGRDWNFFSAWRDPQIIETAEDYTLIMCARTHSYGEASTGAVIAKLKTKDFINYEYLEPLADLGNDVKYAECPDAFEIDGDNYVTFLDHSWGGMRINTATRRDSAGTYYKKLNKTSGEYEWTEEKLLAGSGCDRQTLWAARTFVDFSKERILYSHTTSERPSFSQPKVIKKSDFQSYGALESTDAACGLYLSYWHKMDALIGDKICLKAQTIKTDMGVWENCGDKICGKCGAFSSALNLANVTDFCLVAKVKLSRGARMGFALRAEAGNDEYPYKSVCFIMDYELNILSVDKLYYRVGEGYGRNAADIVSGGIIRDLDEKKFPLTLNKEYEIKLFFREEFLEIYVDGVWQISKAFAQSAPSGSLQFFIERGQGSVLAELFSLKNTVVY